MHLPTFSSSQNPTNTPVTVTLDEPRISQIHVSQNVPTNSPVEVQITNPINNSIHVSQVSHGSKRDYNCQWLFHIFWRSALVNLLLPLSCSTYTFLLTSDATD